MSVDRAFAVALPKPELHAHLSGSISRACLHDIWLQRKALHPELDLADPLVAVPTGKADYDLQTFFPLFSTYIYKLCSDIPSIRYSTERVLQDFEDDNVVYLELRTTPRAIPLQHISKDLYVQTVLSCLKDHNDKATSNLKSYLILSVDRRNTLTEAYEVVELALKYRHDGVVGIDLCGDPSRTPITHLAPAFRRAKEAGLKITLHFAEAPSSSTDEELSELLNWQPDRLGHVIHVKDELREEIVRAKVGVELCLSCNVHAKMLVDAGGYEEHHFGWWKGSGVGVALCTDDVGVFCSPLSEEYYLAAKHFDLSRADVKRICDSAVDIIFGPEEEKARLRAWYASYHGWAE